MRRDARHEWRGSGQGFSLLFSQRELYSSRRFDLHKEIGAVVKCTKCKAEVPDHERHCVVCGFDAGFPNVRAARNEEAALTKRYERVVDEARRRNCVGVISRFEDCVAGARAILCRQLQQALRLASSDTALYANFYREVEGAARIPENNKWDTKRECVDAMLFPHYHKEICFGALAIDGRGTFSYGVCSIELTEVAVCDRASVFEENSFSFVEKRGIPITGNLPVGFRAPWAHRQRLAIAKLGPRIQESTPDTAFPSLLLNENGPEPEFVEVHIYGPIHRRAIARVCVEGPISKAGKVLLASLKRKLGEVGASVEVV